MMAKRQWRATDGGVYGLDFNAVFGIARAMHLTADREFILKVCAYEDEAVSQFRKRDEALACTDKDREHCRIQFGEDYQAWACEQCRDMKIKKRARHG